MLALAVAVVAGGLWIAEGASAVSRHDFFLQCSSGKEPLWMQQKCCETAGGTWVVESYPDGVEIYKCTNIPAGDMPTYEAEQPDDSGSTWTNNVEQAETSGTYEQPEPTPAVSTTTSTDETVEPAPERTYEREPTSSEEPTEERVPRNRAEWYE